MDCTKTPRSLLYVALLASTLTLTACGGDSSSSNSNNGNNTSVSDLEKAKNLIRNFNGMALGLKDINDKYVPIVENLNGNGSELAQFALAWTEIAGEYADRVQPGTILRDAEAINFLNANSDEEFRFSAPNGLKIEVGADGKTVSLDGQVSVAVFQGYRYNYNSSTKQYESTLEYSAPQSMTLTNLKVRHDQGTTSNTGSATILAGSTLSAGASGAGSSPITLSFGGDLLVREQLDSLGAYQLSASPAHDDLAASNITLKTGNYSLALTSLSLKTKGVQLSVSNSTQTRFVLMPVSMDLKAGVADTGTSSKADLEVKISLDNPDTMAVINPSSLSDISPELNETASNFAKAKFSAKFDASVKAGTTTYPVKFAVDASRDGLEQGKISNLAVQVGTSSLQGSGTLTSGILVAELHTTEGASTTLTTDNKTNLTTTPLEIKVNGKVYGKLDPVTGKATFIDNSVIMITP